MRKPHEKLALYLFLSCLAFCVNTQVNAFTKGIYITQSMFEDTRFVSYVIEKAKKVSIDTFIIDIERPSKQYEKNIALVKQNNIDYVARVVIFPNGGGTPEEVTSEKYWEKKYQLIKYAIGYGAHHIQLDYIRYNTKQPSSSTHAENVHKIIKFYKERLAMQKIPLEVDVFGVSSFGEEKHIGQSIKLFSQTVDVLCPMVYPSHYEPFRKHALTPYHTVYDSMMAIRAQFNNKPLPFKLIPYIELSNYRYPLSQQKKLDYIYAQIQAVENSGVDGWYAWSPHNRYENLFMVLESRKVK